MYITGPAAPWTLEYFRLAPVEVNAGYRQCAHVAKVAHEVEHELLDFPFLVTIDEGGDFRCRMVFNVTDTKQTLCGNHSGKTNGKPPPSCEICGAKTKHHRHRWCEEHRYITKACPVCEDDFKTLRAEDNTYCSPSCAQRGNKASRAFVMRAWR